MKLLFSKRKKEKKNEYFKIIFIYYPLNITIKKIESAFSIGS